MKIFLTFDYELFFGKQSGTVDKCMIEPTNDLFELADGKDVFYTFFVDVGFLICADKHPELKEDVHKVRTQIQQMISLGHDVQLHIHPHWEFAAWNNGNWNMNTNGAYKLSDFGQEESDAIVRKYKAYLEELIGRKVIAYRAGGWCIQPFVQVRKVFAETGIKIDSTVIPGDYLMTNDYAVDFREAPMKSSYRFEDIVCEEDENGSFTEFPITSMRYSPLFYWRLYVLGRLFPKKHKMVGDGFFLSQGGRKKRVLTSYSVGHASSDGYFSGKLEAALDRSINLGFNEMVVIGHPKGNTVYSLKKLSDFIENNHDNHKFITFDRLK